MNLGTSRTWHVQARIRKTVDGAWDPWYNLINGEHTSAEDARADLAFWRKGMTDEWTQFRAVVYVTTVEMHVLEG